MKKVTLDVVQTAHERLLRDRVAVADSSDASAADQATDTSDATPSAEDEKSVILTEDDACVHEYCALRGCSRHSTAPNVSCRLD